MLQRLVWASHRVISVISYDRWLFERFFPPEKFLKEGTNLGVPGVLCGLPLAFAAMRSSCGTRSLKPLRSRFPAVARGKLLQTRQGVGCKRHSHDVKKMLRSWNDTSTNIQKADVFPKRFKSSTWAMKKGHWLFTVYRRWYCPVIGGL